MVLLCFLKHETIEENKLAMEARDYIQTTFPEGAFSERVYDEGRVNQRTEEYFSYENIRMKLVHESDDCEKFRLELLGFLNQRCKDLGIAPMEPQRVQCYPLAGVLLQ